MTAAAAHQGRNGKTAGIGEAVEDAFVGNIATGRQAAIALIEIVAGFVAALNINQQLHSVLGDGQQRRRHFAGNQALCQIQTLFFTYRDIAAIVDGTGREQRL